MKVPISGRYTNYHPLAIHSSNIHNSQNCQNETDDTTGNQMHCRTFVYHPTTVYIPHTPPYHTTNNTSLLPTPPPANQYEYNQKQNYRDYTKNFVTPQNNYASQNSNFLIHQNNFSKSQSPGNPPLYNKYNTDVMHKYQSLGIPSSRISGHHYKRYGSNAGSSSCFLSQKATYHSNQRTKSNFEYSNGRRDNQDSGNKYYQGRKNLSRPDKIEPETIKNCQNDLNLTQNNSSSQNESKETGITEKSTSPPPAPYSPMTRPLPTLSPPTSQVQFYNPAQNRYQPGIQHQNQRRYPAPGQARRTSDKYNTNNQTSVIRQSKYKVNGIIPSNNKVTDDSIGGAGDASSRMPITPPATPRNHSSGEQNQLNDSCHQMAALTL